MNVLITGSHGQLGRALLALTEMKAHFVTAVDVDTCDILNQEQLRSAVDAAKPDVIFHCAAYTAVDRAEEDRDAAYNVNVVGTRNVALEARRVHAKLVLISTDYVFHGDGDEPYQIDSPTAPLSWYGKTKLQSEQEALRLCDRTFVVRTSWLFGDGDNFVRTILRLAKTNRQLRVVNDQVGSPTYAMDLAAFIFALSKTKMYGIYHFTNAGYVDWASFASEILSLAHQDAAVLPVSTKEYGSAALRPLNSRLSMDKLAACGFALPRPWRDALVDYLTTEGVISC